MSQPKWKLLQATDYSRIEVDETGVYPPEMEIAQEGQEGIFQVFRFSLDKFKEVKGYLVPINYIKDWPHPLALYNEWFAKDLPSVARSHGTTVKELRAAFCSDEIKDRAWAYESVGGHFGFMNLDSYPLTLSEDELNARWA